jgi:acyl transferase domain-containing protein/surfactin synthase thioesterase subunit/acyl carrier protein
MALDKVKTKLDAIERQKSEPIAIIGMACRFPGGASSPEAFFQLLQDGTDAVTEVPPHRWRLEAAEDAGSDPGRRAVRWGGFLRETVSGFDGPFFGISPREARHLDPQQRLLLEVTWEALERAGQDPTRLVGSPTGVFVGMTTTDYADLCRAAGPSGEDAYTLTGNGHCFAPGRISYTFGLQGPCIAVDTACSSSLVSVHLACQSLRNGEATMAIAGGVNLMLSEDSTRLVATSQGLSPDGRCKAFDAAANGFVRGEGCGIVVLKLLSEAQRDGDTILGLIRGSAINQDGRSTGMTAPNVLSQQAMLAQALVSARVAAGEIGYIETHGTGTSLGDPIELEALRTVLGKPRVDGSRCVLGAVKTNVGHLEAAAGIAGLIKAVMALQQEVIPKNLHFRALNPRISVEGTPFVIPTENTPWRRGAKIRFAGVSSFGMSGTNAHIILEEAPAEESTTPSVLEASCHVVPMSAKSPEALRGLARSYADLLAGADGARIPDVARAASIRRAHHEHRLTATGGTREDLADMLSAFARGEARPGVASERGSLRGRPRKVYVFSGQGSQWVGMGQRLLATEPVFRAKLEQCDALLQQRVSWSLLDELRAPEERSRLAQTAIVQPALFAIQVGIAKLLKSWGIRPDAVIGHSVGEVAAAHVAGALSLDQAVRLVTWRGRVMQQATGQGKMAWVALPPDAAARAIAGRESQLAIAAVNDPGSVVLSGDTAALDEIVATLRGRGVECRPLKVDYAFHSPQMDRLAREFVQAVKRVEPTRTSIPFYSTVTGAVLDGEVLDLTYWAKNLREPVQFARAMESAAGDGYRLFVEVGPHPVLATNMAQCLAGQKDEGRVLVTLRRQIDEREAMLQALGNLYVGGVDVEWKAVQPTIGRHVTLPTYPWQRQDYWVEGAAPRAPAPIVAADPLDGCVFEVRWPKKERAAETAADIQAPSRGAWLLFDDRGGLGAQLASALNSRRQSVIRVISGSRFSCLEPDLYEIDPASPDDHLALLQTAFGSDRPCRGVVHLASLDAAPWGRAEHESLENDQRLGFLSVAFAAQAILRRSWPTKPRLWLVTRGTQAVAGAPVVGVASASIWGLGRTIALEHPELDCSLVDLDPARQAGEASALLHEIEAPEAEAQLAFRGSARHVARLVQSSFDSAPSPTFRLEEHASYLITGGLGGLGLSAAAWMVGQGARHLVLVGRRAPSEDAKAAIRSMEAAGAEVLVFSADVSRGEEVDRVIRETRQRMPRLRGILHAAGVGHQSTLLDQLTESSFWPVMTPKLLGAFHLHAATKHAPLDFFVLYSSASAALGLVGHAGYAGANAVLDAMAHALRDAGVPALSIQWGAFSDAGLAARDASGDRMGRGGLESLTPDQGNLALSRLLGKPTAEVAVMRLAINRWFEVFPQHADSPFWSELHQASASPRPSLAAEPVAAQLQQKIAAAAPNERLELLERLVRDELGKVLRLDPAQITRTDPFYTHGFDSLMGLELRNRLQVSLGLKLSMADIITHAQIDALSEFLAQRFASVPATPGSGARPASSSEADIAAVPADSGLPGSWIVIPRPAPQARMRLFCFPYAGGSASIFGTWPAGLPSEIELCAIQPPGRHERLHEPLPQTIEEMVEALVPALLPYLDRPFAMFGHCMGAIVMLEVIKVLGVKHGLRPEQVFVSGAPSPPLYLATSMAGRSHEEFVELLRYIGFARMALLDDADAVRHLLPAVKSDFEIAARYAYVPCTPIDSPITTFASREDPFAPPSAMEAWRNETTSWFSSVVFPGEHYFIVPEQASILGILGQDLLLRLAAVDQRSTSGATQSSTRRVGSPPTTQGLWLRAPTPRASPRARLFCFPGVGRSSSTYDRWPSMLGDDVEVCLIDLPGRGSRAHELPLGRAEEIVDHLVPALQGRLDVPYAFFGIDIGAILLFETARRLRRAGSPLPSHLFIAAAMAPQTYYFQAMQYLSRDRLLSGLRNLGVPVDESAAAEPALRAEIAAMSGYTFLTEPPLDVPITTFWGKRDFFVPPRSLAGWQQQTAAAFTPHVWSGPHDLVGDEASTVLEVVQETLSKVRFRESA